MSFDDADESDPGPYPIPLDAPIEGGSDSGGDRHVLAVDSDHCKLYELYGAYPDTTNHTWSAGSGAIYGGRHCLQYDLVKEGVTWFSSQSASVLAKNVSVSVPQNGVTWGGTNAPASMAAGSTQSVNVTFMNAGSASWTAGGANLVHLSYHWRNGACPGATSAVWDGIRTSLPADLPPGATVSRTWPPRSKRPRRRAPIASSSTSSKGVA